LRRPWVDNSGTCMAIDESKAKRQIIAVALLAAAITAGVLMLARLTQYVAGAARADSLIEKAVSQTKADPNEVVKHLSRYQAVAEQLKGKNIFVPPEPKQHPVREVQGIMGHEAAINGQWYKVGDMIGDAKIVSIEASLVKIEWQGQVKSFEPMSGGGDLGGSPGPQPGKPAVQSKAQATTMTSEPGKNAVKAPAEDDPFAWAGVDIPKEVRAKLLEKWNQMSEQERAKAKEEWAKMSDEQKQQAVEAMKRLP